MENTETREDVNRTRTDAGTETNQATNNTRDDERAAAGNEADALAKLKEELEGAKDKYIRLYSEFENFRKRTAKEKLDLIQSANEQLLKTLLPVADDFERAENAFPDKNDKDLAGFFLIHSKFKKVLELYGVKIMDTSPGTGFNPDLHEAITQLPAPSPELKGKIVDVVEKGYLLNEKVIRYAKVVVGN
ncbi:MAG: nucleotide exchange factor GrpE [Chryseosolibacter sp.]